MIVIAYKPGRLGNRLVQAAHFCAFALDHNVTVMDLAFDEYAGLFVGPSRDLLCRFPPRQSRLAGRRALRRALFWLAARVTSILVRVDPLGTVAKVLRLDWSEELYLDSRVAGCARGRRPVIVQGWRFQNPQGVQRHRDVIRRHFALRPDAADTVERYIRAHRRPGELLLGVHIRLGDYRGTRYFFPLAHYSEVVRQIASQAERPVRLVICSDEEVDLSHFRDAEAVAGPGTAWGDMYALARCDLIVGPPSTFSSWASFYGDVPLYWMENPADNVRLTDFVVHHTLLRRPSPDGTW
jgi:hypothetical protein